MSMPPSQLGTSYLNFIASHDGIGLRPAESFLTKNEVVKFIDLMEKNGGKVSYRNNNTDTPEPYEINISLFDAMKETFNKERSLDIERFICIHTIMFSLEGVPAIYIHSLFGSNNAYDLYQTTNHNRSLNRGKITNNDLDALNKKSKQSYIFNNLKDLIAIRRKQIAFHPNSTQFTLHLGRDLYGIWRQSLDKKQYIFCISNLTEKNTSLSLLDLNLSEFNQWKDLLSDIEVTDKTSEIDLSPYQTIWLSNI